MSCAHRRRKNEVSQLQFREAFGGYEACVMFDCGECGSAVKLSGMLELVSESCDHEPDMGDISSDQSDAGDGETNLQTQCKKCGTIMTALVNARMFSCPDEE